MIKIRLGELTAAIAFGCICSIASYASGQIVVQGALQNGPTSSNTALPKVTRPAVGPQHLGNGPIDMNNLSADVLNCDVCRQRLGLPPLPKTNGATANLNTANPNAGHALSGKPATPAPVATVAPSQPKSAASKPTQPDLPPVPMLGSPGLISSATASQMEALGIVVEEFKPPQPTPDAIKLGEIPPEARQQFMKGLELPAGAKVLAAEIKGKHNDAEADLPNPVDIESKGTDVKAEATETLPTTKDPKSSQLVQKNDQSVVPHQTFEELAAQFANQQKELERSFAEKTAAWAAEREQLAKERSKLKSQMEQMQSEWLKRMAQADAANREAVTMLEKRTAELNEMQAQVKELKDALAKVKSSSKE